MSKSLGYCQHWQYLLNVNLHNFVVIYNFIFACGRLFYLGSERDTQTSGEHCAGSVTTPTRGGIIFLYTGVANAAPLHPRLYMITDSMERLLQTRTSKDIQIHTSVPLPTFDTLPDFF